MDGYTSLFRNNLGLSYGYGTPQKLYNAAKGSLQVIQRLKLDRKLEIHSGCVNTVCWNDTGQLILSGSDDQYICITDPYSGEKLCSIRSGHRANIFSAKFLPNTSDKQVISCSGDGIICYTQVEQDDSYNVHSFDCHFGTTYEVLTVPQDSHTFLSCGEDGTVRWFDLRLKTSCNKEDCKEDILINCRRAVTSLAINPLMPYQLAVGCSDSSVRIFDRRMLGTRATGNYTGRGITGMISRFTAPSVEGRSHRITSLSYSPEGDEVLVSYSSEYIYLFNMLDDGKLQQYEKKVMMDAVSACCSAPEAQVKVAPKLSTTASLSTSSGHSTPVASPSTSATASSSGATGAEGIASGEGSPKQPPIKRLRLRGDWSDTGPDARPERERRTEGNEQGGRGTVTIMQRMSDMLTRWLEGATRQQEQQRSGEATSSNEQTTEASEQQTEGGAATGNQATEGDDKIVDQPTEGDTATCDQTPEGSAQHVDQLTKGGLQASNMDTEGNIQPTGLEMEEITQCSDHKTGDTQPCDVDTMKNTQPSDQDTEENTRGKHGYQATAKSTEPDGKPVVGSLERREQVSTESGKVGDGTTAGESGRKEQILEYTVQVAAAEGCQEMGTVENVDSSELVVKTKTSETNISQGTETPNVCLEASLQLIANSEGQTSETLGEIKHETITEKGGTAVCEIIGQSSPSVHYEISQTESEINPTNIQGCQHENNESMTCPSQATPATADDQQTETSTAGSPERQQSLEREVRSIRQRIQHQHLEPVISLHYRSEGTSSSEIRVDFTSMNQDQDSLLDQIEESDTPFEVTRSHFRTPDSLASPEGEVRVQGQELSGPRGESERQVSENQNQCVAMETDNVDEQSETLPSVVVPDPTIGDRGTTCDTKESHGDLSSSIKSDCDNNRPLVSDSEHMEIEVASRQQKGSADSAGNTSSSCFVPAIDVVEDTGPADVEAGSCEAPVSTDQGNKEGAAAAEGMEEEGPRRRPGQANRAGTPSSTTSARGRHRRIGHSGPPTGDFQLEDNNGSEDDSDEELMRSSQRSRRGRFGTREDNDLERNIAAIRLQELYRKRQEEREREEREMMNVKQPALKISYKGHRNARTMIKEANFWGSHYVMSGSDCGHIFIWDRYTGKLVQLLEADKHVVNCVQPHPFDPVLASSGIDYDIKLWAPIAEEPQFNFEQASEVTRRNEVMLEETRDTITVPASFMLRMLASLNHIRAGRSASGRGENSSSSSSDEE